MSRPAYRPPSRSRLDPEAERELALLIASNVTVDEAARRLDVSVANVRHAMNTSSFAYGLDRAVAHRFKQGSPEAVEVLFGIMRDAKMPGRVRVDAAKAVLDRAGHVAGPVADKSSDTDLRIMSVEQLGDFITRLEREKSDRAVPVGSPEGVTLSDELPLDFLN